jgi:TP901 family phage tail tape measure protein
MAGAEKKIIDVQINGVNDLLKLKKELRELKKEQNKITKVNEESEKEWIDKERAIDKATKKIKQHRLEITKLDRDQKKADKASKGLAGRFVKMAAVITAVVTVTRLLSRAFKAAITTFTAFEFTMAKVKAISGATDKEFRKLEKTARELGRTTFFTATQVAELQVNYSKLGFSSEEILNVQAATLDLAMATGSDLARSAMVAGSAIRGFGLDASEATRVVDVMAVAFTNSALDIEKWQTSMTKVSAIAASMGVSIEGTAAVMGALADTGIEASIAGTSLRNIFLKMANPTSALAKRIGFTVSTTEDMIKALKILREGQIGQLEMQSLVDVRQVIAMQNMIDSVDTIEKYTFKLNNATGAGREMASIMENTTEGAIKRFKSALEGLAIAISEKVAPTLNWLIDGITRLTSAMTKTTEGSAGKRLEKKLQADQKEMQNLFTAAMDVNNSLDTREVLLARINRKYGDYLDNQLDDIENTEALEKAMEKLNDMYVERISLEVAEEDIREHIKRGSELQQELAQIEIDIMEAEQKMSMTLGQAINKFREERDAEDKKNRADAEVWQDLNFVNLVEGALGKPTAWIAKQLRNVSTTALFTLKEGFKDFSETQILADLIDRQLELRAEELGRPEALEKLKKAYELAQGDFDVFINSLRKKKKKPGPGGDGPPVGDAPNFAQQLAEFEINVRTKGHEDYIADGVMREIAFLKKKEEIAEQEFKQLADSDQKKAQAHVKFLKAKERRIRKELDNEASLIEQSRNNEATKIQERARRENLTDNEVKRLQLENEKIHLEEMLKLEKDYGDKVQKIREKLNQNQENLNALDYTEKQELAQFQIDLAQEVANMTLSIMSNNLAREMRGREQALQSMYDNEINELDRSLRDKEISQANYDGAKMRMDIELQNETRKLEQEAARRERNIARGQAIINGALAVTKYLALGPPGTFAIPMVIAATTAQLAIIESQQFAKGGMIEEFASGGMVQGKSHAQGGEKFAVGGRVVELEGGEAVINKRSTSMFKSQLSAMNQAGGGVKFADGGLLNSSSFASARFDAANFNKMGMAGGNRVVVVESDITTSQNKVKAIQSNAKF